ncbi:23S rRNA (guanosine(2251)-2'-O)-methyltransferase RlmB [bacterium]|jgi:23S rRNA (guanosine2251-2'-O)-methyltransferase|nr:23S rRNA (guanosine(2251)-2'-O)-methyltransferase RlmB [bacterium]
MKILSGKHPIKVGLENQTIDRLIVDRTLTENREVAAVMRLAKSKGIKVQEMGFRDIVNAYNPPQSFQGVLGIGRHQNQLDLGGLIDKKHELIVMLDHMEDPYNFGAILRSAESFGAGGIVYPKDRNVQLTPGVLKVASGAADLLDLCKVTNLAQAIDQLKAADYWIYGADAHYGQPLDRITVHKPAVLVIGNEAKGLSPLIKKKLDDSLVIPTTGQTESLNVSVATGVLLFHISQSWK